MFRRFSTALFIAAVSTLAVVVVSAEKAMPQCPEGQRAVQAEKEIFSRGCGVPGLHIQMDGSEYFEKPCCDLHHACLNLCGSDRDECEKSFERCMDKHCAKAGSKQMQCKSAAQTFSMGTKAMGGHAFKKSQEEHCQCIDESDAETIADAYVPHAERVYRRALSDEEEIEEKLDNFRHKALPKYNKKKQEFVLMNNLFLRYPGTILINKEDDKKKKDDKKGDL